MFNPKYTISNVVLKQLSEIAEIKSEVKRSILLPQREAFLKRAADVKKAHSSTSIEGNQLKEYQVKKVASGEKVIAAADQIKEVKNYLFALKTIDKLADIKKTFNSKDIIDIHKLVTDGLLDKGKTGTYRRGQVYIINILPNGREEVVYLPPSVNKVNKLMNELVEWLEKSEIHPVVRAGLFHYQFETIHPFPDGNGRTGRLMTLLHLYQSGWDFRKILVLDDYYNDNRKEYYESLQTGETYDDRQKADLSVWLEYYVKGFLFEARKVKDQIMALSAVRDIRATRSIFDKDELKIIDFVVSMGQITSSDVVDILDVPKRTAQAKIKRLVEAGVLKKLGSGPTTYYVISSN